MTLYKFYADWCGPCKRMDPVVDKIVEKYGLELVKVNIDEQPHLAADWGINSIPALVLEREGEESKAVIGVTPQFATEQQLGLIAP